MKSDATKGGVQILIAEDSPTQAEQLKYILQQHGYNLAAARNGREALAAIQGRVPTLVISDVLMPEMDGYELCRQIKHDERSKNVPVILLTSLSDPADVVRGLESGADSFIFKPYDEQYLLARVAYILANRHLRENESTQMGVEIFFAGRKFFITSDRLQILNLLLSTYEAAVQKNRELATARDELRHVNEHLEVKVRERTAALEAEIAERKQAEEALRASQQLLQAVVDNSTAVIYVKDVEGRYLLINRRYEELFHFTREWIVGKTDNDVFPKESADAFRAFDQKVLVAGTALEAEEVAPHEDGPHTYISIKCPLHDAGGKPYAVCGISTDITERKQAEQKQQSQLSRLDLLSRITHAIGERQDLHSIFQVVIRNLEENLRIDFGCVCLYEPVGGVLTVTTAGATNPTLAGELDTAEQARIPIDQNGLSRCVQGQLIYEPDTSQVQFPFPQRLACGGLRSLVAAPLVVEGKVFGVLVVARRVAHSFSSPDCEFLRQLSEHVALAAHQAQLYGALQQAYDDLRQTQQAVLQQERLRALGQMASGIAHDINNAISPAALYTESLLDREPNLSERARDYLVTIQRAIDDVAQTVSRMKEFYRQREPQLVLMPIDLNQTVRQVIDLTRARWSDVPQEQGIVILPEMDLASELPSVMGAEGEIRDALTNLILNAVDAMPEGGRLTLRTRFVPGHRQQDEREPAKFVHLEVCDTGVGMDDETKRRCLEPFFTTKGERGTGLGLAMVYGMVERHSAELEIESEPGKGTTMRLIFPMTATVEATSMRTATPARPTQRLRILIVDDDPLLIKSLRDTLESDGHLVTVADGGQAGINAFEAAGQRGEPFALVFTDLGMPYVDGRKVAASIKAASPATPVVLLTGWGQRLVAEKDIPPHVDRVLNKPPKLRELRVVLAELVCTVEQSRQP